MKKIKIRKLHKYLGLIASIYVLLAVISGIIHIVMANFFTPPPPIMPENVVGIEKISIPFSEIIKELPKNFGKVNSVNFRTIKGKLYYQFISDKPAKPRYINALSGKLEKNMDIIYAKEIAKKYLNNSNINQTEFLTNFTNEYLNIFRILPVYKFEAKNKLKEKVYVSTITGSVTLYLNKYRSFSQATFSLMHKFQFIQNKIIRDTLLALSALSVLFVSMLGVWIFVKKI
jgi:hypothetical protein